MNVDDSAPCRHSDTPEDWLVNKVATLLSETIQEDESFLTKHGLTAAEYSKAFRTAIERIRGQFSSTDAEKRLFLESLLEAGVSRGSFLSYSLVKHTKTKVYRVILKSGLIVGLVRKGCPDGDHTTRWERPEWADELYVWWLCPVSKHHPGKSIWKGISRIRGKIGREPENQVDGVIFHDQICGSLMRPCPKKEYSAVLLGKDVPPPCIFVFPNPWETTESENNWRGERRTAFPSALLSIFGIPETQADFFTSYVGVKERVGGSVTNLLVANRYGLSHKSHVIK